MNILGVSAFYHDAAAALIKDGEIVAAAQEERFTREKHDPRFPLHALKYCCEAGGVGPSSIDYVVFYEKPLRKFDRIVRSFIQTSPGYSHQFMQAMSEWLPVKIRQRRLIEKSMSAAIGGKWASRILFSGHHLSHAASAFYPSPFQSAAVVTVDGVGEWDTTTIGVGSGRRLEIQRSVRFPHSLGLLYAAFTTYTGFKVNSGEYKMMGLAPYGEPVYADLIRDRLIDLRNDGSFAINMTYFDYATGSRMTNKAFHDLFGGEPRTPESDITQRDMDLSASIQLVTEEALENLIRAAAELTGETNVCMAGGVALNCVANGRLLRTGVFENIWIQPAAGDAGGALGAALAAHHLALEQPRVPPSDGDSMKGAYLGPSYTSQEVEESISSAGGVYELLDSETIIKRGAELLAQEKVMGWFQGRMEFGPRALGNRSILADPRSPRMQKALNLKIKFRESFRPFAPSVLREDLSEWFDLETDSPYMLLVANVKSAHLVQHHDDSLNRFGIDRLNQLRSVIPAVTHVDNSARIQTVKAETNPEYHALISEFKRLTECPVIVNTSFNIRNEPIVNTPLQAFRCFMGTDMDALVVGNLLLLKTEQDVKLRNDYRSEFQLD